MTCPVCHAGRREPCRDSYGNPIQQRHVARVRAESAARVASNHTAEALRLRAEARRSR